MPFTFTEPQILGWLDAFAWPFLRIGTLLMVAPLFGTGLVPGRVRVLLALAVTAILVPTLPQPPPATVFSAVWFMTLVQQLAIGGALGWLLKLVFEAVVMGGELIALSMGLSFAQMADPLRGVQSAALSQLFLTLATLLFLALDGHLAMIALVARSFELLPVGPAGIGPASLMDMAAYGSWIFLGGVQIALPAITALLLVNLAFGVMSRAAPSLNAMAVGFPVALLFGYAILLMSLPTLRGAFEQLLEGVWLAAGKLLGG